jgi:hypothetical protein
MDQLKKIVIISDWLKTYITQEPYIFSQCLIKYKWEVIMLSTLNIDDLKKHKSVVLFITYDDFDISKLKCNNIKIIYKVDDLFPYTEIRNKCINNCDEIISPYQYLFHNVKTTYPSILDKPGFWIPYSTVTDFYSDLQFNLSPIQKILISGCIDYKYPFRQFMSELNNPHIEVFKHPGYNNYSHDTNNKKFYKKLNEYLCCFCDSLIFNYVLLKVFEIASVGSLLLVDDKISKQLNDLGFYDGENCVMCNQNNVSSKISWIFDDKNTIKVNSLRHKGFELARSRHNTEMRATLFNDIVENNDSSRKTN